MEKRAGEEDRTQAQRLSPRTVGRYEHVLYQQRHIVLKHTQMCAQRKRTANTFIDILST